MEFAASVGAAGMLLPDLHVKEPTAGAEGDGVTPAHDELRNLLRRTGARSVLVENDYRWAVARLRTDITLCRAAAEPSPSKDDR